jgi:hypothetical protein
MPKLTSALFLSVLCAASCGSDPEIPEPSFVSFQLRQVGTMASSTQPETFTEAKFKTTRCSNELDNREFVVAIRKKNSIVNFMEGSARCDLEILSVTAGTENSEEEIFTHSESAPPLVVKKGNQATYISSLGHAVVLDVESTLSDALARQETVSIRIMPQRAENRLPVGSDVSDYARTSPLPEITPVLMNFVAVLNSKNAYTFYLECGTLKNANMCGTVNLFDVRISFLHTVPTDTSYDALKSLAATLPAVIPNESHYVWNGLRMNVATPTARGSRAAMVVTNGDSLRYFTFVLQ